MGLFEIAFIGAKQFWDRGVFDWFLWSLWSGYIIHSLGWRWWLIAICAGAGIQAAVYVWAVAGTAPLKPHTATKTCRAVFGIYSTGHDSRI